MKLRQSHTQVMASCRTGFIREDNMTDDINIGDVHVSWYTNHKQARHPPNLPDNLSYGHTQTVGPNTGPLHGSLDGPNTGHAAWAFREKPHSRTTANITFFICNLLVETSITFRAFPPQSEHLPAEVPDIRPSRDGPQDLSALTAEPFTGSPVEPTRWNAIHFKQL